MSHLPHFIWVFTVCQSTCLPVSRMKMVKGELNLFQRRGLVCRRDDFSLWKHNFLPIFLMVSMWNDMLPVLVCWAFLLAPLDKKWAIWISWFHASKTICFKWQLLLTGLRSAVSNVSDCRYVSVCKSRGREFDPSPVPYFHGDWSWNNFYSCDFCLTLCMLGNFACL